MPGHATLVRLLGLVLLRVRGCFVKSAGVFCECGGVFRLPFVDSATTGDSLSQVNCLHKSLKLGLVCSSLAITVARAHD